MKNNATMDELKLSLLSRIQQLNEEQPAGIQEETLTSLGKAESLSFPGNKNEEWKYSPFRIPAGGEFQLLQGLSRSAGEISREPFGDCTLLVFVDSVFAESLSDSPYPKGMSIGKIESSEPWIAPYENSIFSHLNNATAHQAGIVIRIEAGAVLEKPIVLMHLPASTDSASWVQPRVQVEVGERAEVRFAEFRNHSESQPTVINAITEIRAGKASQVQWVNFEKGNAQISLVNQTRVETAEKAVFQHVSISLGEGYLRNNLEIKITGEYGDAHMYGLTLGNRKLHVDHHTYVRHMPENTTSNQLYKGIFGGKSTGVFNGKILVDQPAQKTNAYQSSKNILISPDARVFAKPQLEIFADDVKCSHGATIGQLDEEPIFYLRSRGLDLPTARMLLVQAFASEILMKISDPSLREWVEKEVLAEMDRMILNP